MSEKELEYFRYARWADNLTLLILGLLGNFIFWGLLGVICQSYFCMIMSLIMIGLFLPTAIIFLCVENKRLDMAYEITSNTKYW